MTVNDEATLATIPSNQTPVPADAIAWDFVAERYRRESWRSPIFRDLVLHDLARLGPEATVLDIGCGNGFDDSPELQASLAERAGHYIGIEPDADVPAPACCHDLFRTTLEDAPLAANSIDLAYAVFVLEHVSEPESFFRKLHHVLKDGGVFWGFTVDARNFFAIASRSIERMGLKERYLDRLDRKGKGRYRNYPTCYLVNTPRAIRRVAADFRRCETRSFHRVGLTDRVVPPALRPAVRLWDRLTIATGMPGANLVVRLEK